LSKGAAKYISCPLRIKQAPRLAQLGQVLGPVFVAVLFPALRPGLFFSTWGFFEDFPWYPAGACRP